MLREYIAAGFVPAEFWTLTPRLYALHMEGAAERVRREIEISNRTAWNTAALTGAAFAGKLPDYEKVFGGSAKKAQEPEVQEAMLSLLAKAWGV